MHRSRDNQLFNRSSWDNYKARRRRGNAEKIQIIVSPRCLRVLRASALNGHPQPPPHDLHRRLPRFLPGLHHRRSGAEAVPLDPAHVRHENQSPSRRQLSSVRACNHLEAAIHYLEDVRRLFVRCLRRQVHRDYGGRARCPATRRRNLHAVAGIGQTAPTNVFQVVNRCFQIMQARTEERWRRESDLVLVPDVRRVEWDGFGSGAAMVKAGEEAGGGGDGGRAGVVGGVPFNAEARRTRETTRRNTDLDFLRVSSALSAPYSCPRMIYGTIDCPWICAPLEGVRMTSASQFAITGLKRAPRSQEFPCLGADAFAESLPAAGSVWFLKRILRNRLSRPL